MRGKCLQHKRRKKTKYIYIYWIYKLEVQRGKKKEKNIYILNIKKKTTNHRFTMDNGYELNWLLRSGLVLKINKDSKIRRSNS